VSTFPYVFTTYTSRFKYMIPTIYITTYSTTLYHDLHDRPSASDLPTGPALFGVSWDAGNASKRRSYTPILISVGNTDYCGADSCFCIAYLPKLPLTPGQLGTDPGKKARHELTQRCIGAILEVIEQSAVNGFKCTLRTG